MANNQNAFKDKYLPEMQELIFKEYPTVQLLMASAFKGERYGKINKDNLGKDKPSVMGKFIAVRGAKSLKIDVATANMNSATTGAGVQSITNTHVDFLDQAEYTWTNKYIPIAISADDWAINESGSEDRVIDLMKTAIRRGMSQMLSEISSDIWGSGYTASAGVMSIPAAVSNSGITYAGIDRTSVSAWIGNYATGTLSNADDPTNADYLLDKVYDAISTVMDNGAQESDLVIIMGSSTHKVLWQQYVHTTTTSGMNGRYDIKNGDGVPGFSGLSIAGVPVIRDSNAPAGSVTILDLGSTHLVGLDGFTFDAWDEWKPGETSTAYINRLMFAGQLAVTAPRKNYYLLYS